MRVDQLQPREFVARIQSNRLILDIGPFKVRIGNRVPGSFGTFKKMYGATKVNTDIDEPLDFCVTLQPGKRLHRWWRPQAVFETDGTPPFTPFPQSHAFALFEWGLNWCIAVQAHQYLMFHSAVLERHGKAILLPAQPGSGKSTLCAALMLRGWRLLSDEFGLYRPETGMLEPMPRPIPLKNESIDIIRNYSDQAVLGPVFEKTRKGDVAHLRPTDDSVTRAAEPAKPAWVVFPRFIKGADTFIHDFAKGRAFLKLSGNAFNYRLQGTRGFDAVANLVDICDTHYLEFGDLDAAVDLITAMAEATPSAG